MIIDLFPESYGLIVQVVGQIVFLGIIIVVHIMGHVQGLVDNSLHSRRYRGRQQPTEKKMKPIKQSILIRN